ncbi:MAG: hypothetical protein P8M78_09260 [Myxococcota bacterium]|nr:hypothetical protein [Myxococcota bacterium]
MDAKVAYWTAAFVNLGVLTGFATVGALRARRGEIARHRRAVTVAAVLVLVFLASYPFKLWFLGRENLLLWGTGDVWLLRVHEACVLVMLIAGTTAIVRGRRLARTAPYADGPEAPPVPRDLRSRHLFAGRLAILAAGAGWLTAGLVLAGMYGRL